MISRTSRGSINHSGRGNSGMSKCSGFHSRSASGKRGMNSMCGAKRKPHTYRVVNVPLPPAIRKILRVEETPGLAMTSQQYRIRSDSGISQRDKAHDLKEFVQ